MKKCSLIFLFSVVFVLSSLSVSAETCKSLAEAMKAPEKVTSLFLGTSGDESETLEGVGTAEEGPKDSELQYLPETFGLLTHLKELQITGLEKLEELPAEIGNLKELESIIIDNGNGYQMNISLPETIGNLTRLKILILYGALDARAFAGENEVLARVKELPQSLAKLQNLRTLDIGRNGLTELPAQVAELTGLITLKLDYNQIKELPEFVGNLKDLKYLSINSNGGTKLPDSLKNLKDLKIGLGNASLKLEDQEDLRKRFPDALLDFTNEFDDETANEEIPVTDSQEQPLSTD